YSSSTTLAPPHPTTISPYTTLFRSCEKHNGRTRIRIQLTGRRLRNHLSFRRAGRRLPPMTLEGLFKKRYSLYMKNLLKYARHIINDHFVLVLFLLIGVGGYTYSQFLETVAYGMVEPRILVLFLFFVLTSAGSITLLLEPADRIFLLPKEREFRGIFKHLTARSFASQMISTALLTFVTFPIFVTTLDVSTTDSLFIFLTLASLKWLNLLTKIYPFFCTHQKQERKLELAMQVLKILTLISLLFIQIRITVIIITAIALFSAYQFFTEKMYF